MNLVETTSLSHDYGGTVLALDNLNVEIPGGVVGLVGANGAGKTTLLRIILGLLHPSGGAVTVLGTSVADDALGLRSRIGYMPEGKCLPLDQTAADFVAFTAELAGIPSTEARRRASETLFLVGLHEERFRYLGDFSTGMQQRVKLAQSIVGDPDLVLLDEPAAGLDPAGREQMLDLIRRLREFGINVMFSSHILEDIEQTCDWVVMLDAGRLVRNAPLEPPSDGDEVSVEVIGDPELVATALIERGAQTFVDGQVIRVVHGGVEDVFDLVIEALAEHEIGLRRMGTSLSSLEDLFLKHEAERG
ncbi:MAG: ABC transporter ATP-binding protein [Acidimicrobiia bacterium]|nr:ABC transporter ATP-binding protein [Acidimicrobiia bacterium]